MLIIKKTYIEITFNICFYWIYYFHFLLKTYYLVQNLDYTPLLIGQIETSY